MPQPVRKQIKEIHSDIIHEPPFRTLLVDGNSLLFSCMADEKVNSDGIHYGGIFQFLLQLRIMITKGEFKYIYCFFDNKLSGVLRWKIYPYYKQNRDKHYEEYGVSDYMKEVNAKVRDMMKYFNQKNAKRYNNSFNDNETLVRHKSDWEKFIDANFDRERDILCRYFNELYIRWNIDEITEGDDQIAYYCLHKKPNEKIVIISTDMDLAQLISDDICIYNQQKDLKKFITNKNFKEIFGYDYRNVLVKKILTGDSSDNIGNIKGLSEDGFFKLMPEAKTRQITVEEVKERAKNLIDERISQKRKPLQVHENILNGVSNKA
jgi:5'-3' exonuclease